MRTTGPWPLDPTVTFLNHGSFGACPEPVLAAQAAWRERIEADPVRFFSRELEGHLDAARTTLGEFLGADPEGIAFVPNATTAVGTVLGSLRFGPGDELLTTDHEYNATLNSLAAAARRDGARMVVARVPFPVADPGLVVEAVLSAVTDRTRLALISHVTSPTGIVFPIAEIVRELDRRGIDAIVDAAHAPGMVPAEVGRLGAAYWTGNGHKWLCGPKGAALLWVREDRRDAIHPLVVSHGANDPRVEAGLRSRFRVEFDWPGTVDPTPYLAAADAVALVAGLAPDGGGWPAIQAANHELAVTARRRLCEALAVEPPAPEAMLGSMAALVLPVTPSDEAALALTKALAEDDRIEVPVGAWPVLAGRISGGPQATLVRISAQLYNEPSDYDRLADALVARLSPSTGGPPPRR
ncbi:MAG TPA: aminotransferase class V-fold PLP-dependent enzyme [Candidatus Limnocylindrales bacterium]|nr:aminotransferase class V-fold PLP-dependent enzyme [Candidatus Limnocylindrales bacterium]